ncbi:HAD domain-containing protein [Thauera phenylacetica]|uniref:HAD domain-containing protein n=1 Tax=Thauera phenylacetica TaxID=164400 RepID=UPI0012FAE1C3|nr:HAD domain-containing protein [Thauera phenylacetica]
MPLHAIALRDHRNIKSGDHTQLRRWVAVDDDAKGWDEPARLVQTNPETGLSDPSVVARLSGLLGEK